MRKVLSLLVLLLGFAPAKGFAHEGGLHVKGTVAALSAEQITVQGASGGPSEIHLTEQTRFVRAGAPAKREDLRPGDRVVVHVRKKKGSLEATEIHFAARVRARP